MPRDTVTARGLPSLSARLLRLSRRRRAIYTAAAFVAYVAAFYPLFLVIGPTTGVIGLVPVVVTGLLWGSRAALGMALLCLASSSTMYYLFGGYAPTDTWPRTLPAHVVYGAAGALVGAVRRTALALRDERARVERSRALLLTAERLARIGSWESNLTTGESNWSDGAYRIFGLELGAIPASLDNAMARVHPEDRERVERATRAAYAERRADSLEFRVVRPDGGVATLAARVSFVEEPDGARAIGVVWDVTDRRDLEARLFLADRMASLGTLAGGVAHEINNPLAIVAANVDYVRGELERADGGRLGDLEGATAALTEAHDGARRIAAVVGDLRTFARGAEETLAPVEVNRVVASALALAKNELRHRATVVQALGEVPPVIADEPRLAQVLVNLLVNAAHALPEGDAAAQRVTVTTRLVAGRVEIDVADTGRGIPAEDRARIFDPFFTTRKPGAGMGLGLAICHGIVDRLGGELSVVTSEVGVGTTMRVSLPPAPAAVVEPPRPSPSPPPAVAERRRARVLVVDDEELLLQAIRRSLGGQHDLELAADGKRALELLAEKRYDVILCDLLMPEVSGMDVHAALVARGEAELARRMVFMTGGAFTARAQAFLETVPNLRLDKPVSTKLLGKLFAERAGTS